MVRQKLIYSLLITGMFLLALRAPAQESGPDLLANHCASPAEVELYNLITAFRKINNLPPVPFSKSLSYVARVHMMDITDNRPDFGGCNPHSWSDKGQWKPCCYARDEKRITCMTEKPKELTMYKAKAWEIVYEGGEPARAEDAFNLWKNISLTRDYLINGGKWTKPWKAIGIGIYGDYAAVWFGEGDDPEKIYTACGSDSAFTLPGDPEITRGQLTENPSAASPVFSIITGSLNTLEKANREVARLRGLGYPKARLIPAGNNYRISIADYPTETEAQRHLREIQAGFPDAWVLKPDAP
ncbi:MAG TPA: SPOR domain-containing protein [Lentimicrobium sp.]|nr:SPOR domain-containing protein [Lentimicrobium sp.]